MGNKNTGEAGPVPLGVTRYYARPFAEEKKRRGENDQVIHSEVRRDQDGCQQ